MLINKKHFALLVLYTGRFLTNLRSQTGYFLTSEIQTLNGILLPTWSSRSSHVP